MAEGRPEVDIISSPFNSTIYHLGPALSEGSLPTFFYFALSGEDSLSLAPFCDPISHLKEEPIRKISFTLPYHGKGFSNKEAMGNWANEFENGHDFLKPFFDDVLNSIQYLIDKGYTDADKIVIGGLSRGGFIAAHLASKEPRFKAILGFASTDVIFFERGSFLSKRHPQTISN